MPTKTAIGQRRAIAVARLEKQCQALAQSDQPLVVPMHSRFGSDVLLCVQLETIADYLEAAVETLRSQTDSQYDGLSFSDLKATAIEQGLDVTGLRSKAAVIELLEGNQEAEEA